MVKLSKKTASFEKNPDKLLKSKVNIETTDREQEEKVIILKVVIFMHLPKYSNH